MANVTRESVKTTLSAICNPLFVKPPRETTLEEGNMDPQKDQAHADRIQRMADHVAMGMTPDGKGYEPTQDEDKQEVCRAIFRM